MSMNKVKKLLIEQKSNALSKKVLITVKVY